MSFLMISYDSFVKAFFKLLAHVTAIIALLLPSQIVDRSYLIFKVAAEDNISKWNML